MQALRAGLQRESKVNEIARGGQRGAVPSNLGSEVPALYSGGALKQEPLSASSRAKSPPSLDINLLKGWLQSIPAVRNDSEKTRQQAHGPGHKLQHSARATMSYSQRVPRKYSPPEAWKPSPKHNFFGACGRRPFPLTGTSMPQKGACGFARSTSSVCRQHGGDRDGRRELIT